MAKETVDFLITAQDKASAKFEQARKSADKNVRSIKEMGGQAKASTEMVGTLAMTLGGGWLGQTAGEIAMLTERMSAFSEVSKLGKLGMLAFKAGVVAAAAALAVKLGSALSKIINDFKGFQVQVALANDELARTTSLMVGGMADQFEREKERIGLIIDPDEQDAAMDQLSDNLQRKFETIFSETAAAKQKLEEMRVDTGFFGGQSDEFKEEIKIQEALVRSLEQQRDVLQSQRDEIRYQLSDQKKQLDAMREAKEQHEEMLKTQKEAREEAARNFSASVIGAWAKKAKEANDEAKKLADEQKRLDDIARRYAESVAIQEIRLTQGNEAAEAYRLTLQGLTQEQADQLAAEKARVDAIADQQSKDQEARAARERLAETTKRHVQQLELEAIKLREGEEAADLYQLKLDGLDDATARRIASARQALRELQETENEVAKTRNDISVVDDRFSAGRPAESVGMDAAHAAKIKKHEHEKEVRQGVVDIQKKYLDQLRAEVGLGEGAAKATEQYAAALKGVGDTIKNEIDAPNGKVMIGLGPQAQQGDRVEVDYSRKTSESTAETAKLTKELVDKSLPRLLTVMEEIRDQWPEVETI